MTNTNTEISIAASREGLVSYLSTSEKGFHAISQLFGEMKEAENSITAEVLSTYLGLLALAVNKGQVEFLLDYSVAFMRAYLAVQGETEDLTDMETAIEGFKREIKIEREKPIAVAESATVH